VNEADTAWWWARIRSGGPQRVAPGAATAAGLRRLVEADAQAVWLLADPPESAGPAVLQEYGLPALSMTDSRGTLRVLAACLRCCWTDPGADIWPGRVAGVEEIAVVFTRLVPGRDPLTRHRTLVAGLRRLAAAGWLLFDETGAAVRVGPKVASWTTLELSTLRELWRMVPAGERPAAGQGDP
jgi:hypothetical protein